MPWNKVGEYITDILVNGSQEASYNQSSDSDYDVSVSSNSPNYNWNKIWEESVSDELNSTSESTEIAPDNGDLYKLEIETKNSDESLFRISDDDFSNDKIIMRFNSDDANRIVGINYLIAIQNGFLTLSDFSDENYIHNISDGDIYSFKGRNTSDNFGTSDYRIYKSTNVVSYKENVGGTDPPLTMAPSKFSVDGVTKS